MKVHRGSTLWCCAVWPFWSEGYKLMVQRTLTMIDCFQFALSVPMSSIELNQDHIGLHHIFASWIPDLHWSHPTFNIANDIWVRSSLRIISPREKTIMLVTVAAQSDNFFFCLLSNIKPRAQIKMEGSREILTFKIWLNLAQRWKRQCRQSKWPTWD